MKKTLFFAALALFAAGLAFGGTITVSIPDGSDVVMGSTVRITWTAVDVRSNVKIRLVRPGGALIEILTSGVEADSSPFPWLVDAPAEVGGTYKIHVKANDNSAEATSATFTVVEGTEPVVPGTISNVRLGGTSPYNIGNSVPVSWSATGVTQQLKLELLRSTNVSAGTIVTPLAVGTASYSWTAGSYVGGTATIGDYKVRVSTIDNALSADSATFSLATTPGTPGGSSIDVTKPDSSDSWLPGSRHEVTWTCTGSVGSMVSVTLRREGAAEADPPAARICDGCANGLPGYRHIDWFIPESLAEDRYYVRVKEAGAAGIHGDSDVFSISATGQGSELAGPDTAIRCDLEMPGVGIEHYNGHIVAWVKNNGPESLRDRDVKFLLDFPELGGGGHYITKRLTIPVGSEEGVELQAMAREEIPPAGLRVIVSIETSRSHIVDPNRLNQHRDVRIGGLDIVCEAPRSDLELARMYLQGGEDYRVKFKIKVHHTLSGQTVRNIPVRWEMTGGDIPAGYGGNYTIASLASGIIDVRQENRTFGKKGVYNAKKPELSPGTTYRIRAWIDDVADALADVQPGNDSATFTFSFSAE
jgi:hypothetical protein